MKISMEHGIIGAGKGSLASAENCDLVILIADRPNKGERRVLILGVFGARLTVAPTIWNHDGGHLWKHNFYFTPVTGEILISTWYDQIRKVSSSCGIKLGHLFNSRFPGVDRKLFLLRMIAGNPGFVTSEPIEAVSEPIAAVAPVPVVPDDVPVVPDDVPDRPPRRSDEDKIQSLTRRNN
jgi:hypothetical protein